MPMQLLYNVIKVEFLYELFILDILCYKLQWIDEITSLIFVFIRLARIDIT